MSEIYQTSKELTPMLFKLSHKREREGALPHSFCEARISLTPKPDKDMTKKRKVQTNFLNEHRHKNSQSNICKPNSTAH
jgi:hypothetical protein